MKKTETKTSLGLGFTLVETDEGTVIPVDTALNFVSQLSRLDDIASNPERHHYYCKRLLEFLDDGRKTFREFGKEVKLQSPIPISVVRYALTSKLEAHVYRFLATIFHRNMCTFDHATAWHFKDYIRTEFKTIFNVTYTIEIGEDGSKYMVRKNHSGTSRINDVLATLSNIDHPAFVLQAIKGLAALEPGRVYKGRFYQMELILKEAGNFAIRLDANKINNDSVLVVYEEGRFKVTLIQSVQRVAMEVTDLLLYEILQCVVDEFEHDTPVRKTMNQLKSYKHRR